LTLALSLHEILLPQPRDQLIRHHLMICDARRFHASRAKQIS
jgi:hypothetical protein